MLSCTANCTATGVALSANHLSKSWLVPRTPQQRESVVPHTIAFLSGSRLSQSCFSDHVMRYPAGGSWRKEGFISTHISRYSPWEQGSQDCWCWMQLVSLHQHQKEEKEDWMDAAVLISIRCLPMIKMDLPIPQDDPILASQRPVSQVSLDAVRSASTILLECPRHWDSRIVPLWGLASKGLFVSLSVTFPSLDPGHDQGRRRREVEGVPGPSEACTFLCCCGCHLSPGFRYRWRKTFVFDLDGACFWFHVCCLYCWYELLLLWVSKPRVSERCIASSDWSVGKRLHASSLLWPVWKLYVYTDWSWKQCFWGHAAS